MSENIFDIIKYGNLRPVYYRNLITEYFEQFDSYRYLSDWKSIDSVHYDHQVAETHYIQIEVYFDKELESTCVVLHIKDDDIKNVIKQKSFDVQIRTAIMTDYDFIEIFTDYYKDMNQACIGIWHHIEENDY